MDQAAALPFFSPQILQLRQNINATLYNLSVQHPLAQALFGIHKEFIKPAISIMEADENWLDHSQNRRRLSFSVQIQKFSLRSFRHKSQWPIPEKRKDNRKDDQRIT
jgi:hypothetical protein